MDEIDIINLVRRANFSAKDYRVRIDMTPLDHVKTTHDSFKMEIYIGHLAKIGLGTPVFSAIYHLHFNGYMELRYLDVFRPGRWIKKIEESALIVERNMENKEMREKREKERLHSPINDRWIFP